MYDIVVYKCFITKCMDVETNLSLNTKIKNSHTRLV
jgi:hypothetical protein